MMEIKQSQTFARWLNRLPDRTARTLIAARITRLAEGLAGDVASVGGGVNELRIHFGPGYRVYFQRRGLLLILLLCGGAKSSQARDIAVAQAMANTLE